MRSTYRKHEAWCVYATEYSIVGINQGEERGEGIINLTAMKGKSEGKEWRRRKSV